MPYEGFGTPSTGYDPRRAASSLNTLRRNMVPSSLNPANFVDPNVRRLESAAHGEQNIQSELENAATQAPDRVPGLVGMRQNMAQPIFQDRPPVPQEFDLSSLIAQRGAPQDTAQQFSRIPPQMIQNVMSAFPQPPQMTPYQQGQLELGKERLNQSANKGLAKEGLTQPQARQLYQQFLSEANARKGDLMNIEEQSVPLPQLIETIANEAGYDLGEINALRSGVAAQPSGQASGMPSPAERVNNPTVEGALSQAKAAVNPQWTRIRDRKTGKTGNYPGTPQEAAAEGYEVIR